MASPFPGLLTFLVTFVFLCSAQSVCRPPADEKCVCNCNQVTTCKTDDAVNTELEQLKVTVDRLTQTLSDWRNDTRSLDVVMEELLQERNKTKQLQSETAAKSRRIQELEQRNCTEQNNDNATVTYRPQDCKDILDNDETTPSGMHMVYPRDNLRGFLVFCDMDTDGGGWTLFQRRQDGTVGFYRGWAAYKTGFPSNLNGEFWLGNDNLYRLAVQKVYQLRVDMEDFEGNTAYAAYDTFAISPESENYKLHIGTYSGTAGDSLTYHDGKPFSTKDRDNDEKPSSCAQLNKGALWYASCHYSNLNGLYHLGTNESNADGVIWYHWKGYNYSLKRTEMKLRPAP